MLSIINSSGPKQDDVNLVVSLNGLNIRVEQGTFRRQGRTYTISEDIVHQAELSDTHITVLVGMLVLSEGQPHVLVDEYVKDGVDEPYDPTEDDVVFLRTLFRARCPPGTQDLASMDSPFKVYHYTHVPPAQADLSGGQQ